MAAIEQRKKLVDLSLKGSDVADVIARDDILAQLKVFNTAYCRSSPRASRYKVTLFAAVLSLTGIDSKAHANNNHGAIDKTIELIEKYEKSNLTDNQKVYCINRVVVEAWKRSITKFDGIGAISQGGLYKLAHNSSWTQNLERIICANFNLYSGYETGPSKAAFDESNASVGSGGTGGHMNNLLKAFSGALEAHSCSKFYTMNHDTNLIVGRGTGCSVSAATDPDSARGLHGGL
jgi:hypothetical protein